MRNNDSQNPGAEDTNDRGKFSETIIFQVELSKRYYSEWTAWKRKFSTLS